ncbi:MAG: thermonuclease family protein [Desulfovibrionaceae bacterium]|nr:thermonuclease family protein [Desulfovibrionaceae bacterium]
MPRRSRKNNFRRKRRFLPLIVGAVILFGLFSFTQGKVVKVSDGDTLDVLDSSGELVTVRLYGVDCPEYMQDGGPEALEHTRELALMKKVKLTVFYEDQYGRKVALVHLPDGKILNRELLRGGHAWVYENYCKESFCDDWRAAQKQARREKKGLWKQKSPQAPWNWRKRNN